MGLSNEWPMVSALFRTDWNVELLLFAVLLLFELVLLPLAGLVDDVVEDELVVVADACSSVLPDDIFFAFVW